MVSEDIITSLKNAVAKGETLESAMQTLVISGYNARDVQEASQYIGSGVVHIEKASQDKMLAMPNQKKGFFSNLFSKKQAKQPEQAVKYNSPSSQILLTPQENTNRMQTQSKDMSFSSIPLPEQYKQPSTRPQIQQTQIKTQIQQPVQMQRVPQQNQQPLPHSAFPPTQQLPPTQQPPPTPQTPKQPFPQPVPQPPQQHPQQPPQQPPQQVYTNPPNKKPKKQSYTKEIILLIMLLILSAILIITFRYRAEIVAFFSS